MKNEYEIIEHNKIKHINILFTKIKYRVHHFHSDIELFCVINGNADINIGEKTYSVQKGSIILINSDELHEIDSQQGSVCGLVIQISNHFLMQYFPCLRTTTFLQNDLCEVLDTNQILKLWNLILDLSYNYINESDYFELDTISKISKLVVILLQKVNSEVKSEKDYLCQKKIAARMNRIVTYIDENHSMKIKLSDIANTEKVSTTHLSHFFTQNFGITFQDYLNGVRFECAIRNIVNTSISIFDVSLISGFSDPKYLTKIFKQKYGCTPAEFRNKIEQVNLIDESHKLKILEQYYNKAESLMLIENFKL